MESQYLIDQTKHLWKDLQQKIQYLQVEKKSTLASAQYALAETDQAIRTIKNWVITHDFDCWESEIVFFKNLKPLFIAQYIYFSKIVSLLSSLPASGSKHKKKVYENEFHRLQDFFLENRDFISYYRRKATYLDSKYFLRFTYDLDVQLAPDFHSYDERFSTSHDHLVATILAHDDYEIFLKAQLSLLKENEPTPEIAEIIHWTASKTALTEMIFALHQTKCLNGGTLDLAETVRWFEHHLHIDLGNYHKTLGEIRARKEPQTKFLQLLSHHLNTYLENLDR